jgi:hypothetical protein
MRHSRRPLAALGILTLAAASLGGCSATTQVAEYNPNFAPTTVNPAAYDILIASAVYRPSSGLALGAGDHFGNIVHDEYVALVRNEVAPTGRYATVPTDRSH